MSGLVTGEAVALELRAARLPSRVLALGLDLLLQGALLIGGVVSAFGLATDPALEAALGLSVVVSALVGYPVAFETLGRGRSPGKRALGLRVVREDGGPVRLRHALVRAVVGVVEIFFLFGVPAVVVSMASERGQRVGDLLAGTLVVRERAGPRMLPPATPMPAGLAGWAGGLDLSRLPDDLALAARSYLARWGQLSPAARDELGLRLARDVHARVSPDPPPGVGPQAYLAAVLAERTRRALGAYGGAGSPAAESWRAGGVTPAPPGVAAAPAAPPEVARPDVAPEAPADLAPEASAPPAPSGDAGPRPGGFVPPA